MSEGGDGDGDGDGIGKRNIESQTPARCSLLSRRARSMSVPSESGRDKGRTVAPFDGRDFPRSGWTIDSSSIESSCFRKQRHKGERAINERRPSFLISSLVPSLLPSCPSLRRFF